LERLVKKAAFLDRDGTINVRAAEHEYIARLADFAFLPGAVDGMARLADCGYELVVVSNQRGVARGIVDEAFLRASEKAINQALAVHGMAVAAFYYCPHEADEDCECRKPRPGMLLRAARERDLDLASSWMVGDSATDIEAGTAAGCRTAAVGSEVAATDATLVAASLGDAAGLICAASEPV
jgi:D-glycero-D-manno-heptose 1,7-bisphosphate phosphatase